MIQKQKSEIRKISGLYAITPDSADTDELLNKVQQVLEGGTRMVQYRNKSADRRLREKQAGLLQQLCSTYGTPLIINDHVDLAIEIGADGLHLGRDDMTVADARARLGWNRIIGVSCYDNQELAFQAERNGADYVAFGAFFSSVTKPDTVLVSAELVSQASRHLGIPIIGIGGIRLANAGTVIQSGCSALAVCHDLFHARDCRAAAKNYMQLFLQLQ